MAEREVARHNADPRISPRLVDDLFSEITHLAQESLACKFEVECTFMEVYNKKVRYLLETPRSRSVNSRRKASSWRAFLAASRGSLVRAHAETEIK